ncbi:MAG: transcription antiterminator [Bacteroidota bacterium]|nr:transcription antiterminator [Bacteroidota bacterium]
MNWYAVYVNAKHEKKVVQKLQERQLEAYSPMVKKLQQWSDRKKWVEFPMLSGYVFVHIDTIDREKVLTCPGVFSFIKFNGVEAKVRDVEIAVLKSIEQSGYDVITEASDIKLSDEVEITQGPLKGLKGTVIEMQNLSYIKIQLQSLHQSIKIQLPKHSLKVQPLNII